MKTKAYKLAAELGLQEQSVLEWLRANGYPNARRADTIRADVAQAARQALGRGGGPRGRRSQPGRLPPQSRKSRQSGRTERRRISGGSDGGARPAAPAPPPPAPVATASPKGGDGFRVSFADLLEAHLPADITAGRQALPQTNNPEPQPPPPPAAQRSRSRPAPTPVTRASEERDELRIRVARAEQDRDRARQQADVERARAEGFARDLQRVQVELEAARRNLGALDALREDNERLSLERATLKKQLAEATDERETLEQTCGELQGEVDELKAGLEEARGALEESRQESIDQSAVLGDLETARQREVAWRTRALELERAVSAGGDVIRLLRSHGLENVRQQVRVLQALLADEKAAVAVLKSIRQVDAQAIGKLLDDNIRPTCAHPLCNRVARAAGKLPLRVDDESECAVCGGDAEKRWFAHMVGECALAGVRRLLVIGGGDSTHDRLRALSEGQPVDLRLVSAEEEALPARAAGRVEGCDALVRWSTWVVPEAVTGPYVDAALAADRPIVSVLGRVAGVVPLARATVNRIARNHVLRAV